MTDRFAFVIDGEPVPKGRARSAAMGQRADGSTIIRTYTPAATVAYEQRAKVICQVAVNRARWTWTDKDRFAVEVHIYRTHEGKGGDADNHAKAVLDAMNGVAFADDRYVRRLFIILEPPDRVRPRVSVIVARLPRHAAKGASS